MQNAYFMKGFKQPLSTAIRELINSITQLVREKTGMATTVEKKSIKWGGRDSAALLAFSSHHGRILFMCSSQGKTEG